MKAMIRKRPWLIVLGFYMSFIGVWVWFAIFAAQHSPEKVQPTTGIPGHASH